MEQVQMANSIKRILTVSLVLMLISTFAFIVFGIATLNTNKDIKLLNDFLDEAKESQPNFEKSLEMYTDTTKEIIEYLISLRPGTEEDLLRIITEIEEMGVSSGLNINLKSTSLMEDVTSTEDGRILNYNVSFYGNVNNIKDFLIQLESLPYFIKVDAIEYGDAGSLSVEDLKRKPNILIKISLYIK